MALTKSDQKIIANIVSDALTENNKNLEITLDEKFEEINNKINHLPTKDEFYSETSKIYKKMQDLEDDMVVRNHRVQRNEDNIKSNEKRISKLERALVS